MKKIILTISFCTISLIQAKETKETQSANSVEPTLELPDFGPLKTKSDFLHKNDKGAILFRGKYIIGDGGKVSRYDIYKEGTNEVIQTDIPVYDNSGSVALIKSYNSRGELQLIAVAVEVGHVYVSPKGETLTQTEAAKLVNPLLYFALTANE